MSDYDNFLFMKYIIAGLFNVFRTHFKDTGIDVQQLFDKHDTDIRILDNPIAPLKVDIYGEFLERVVATTHNHRIGLEAGFRIPFVLTASFFNIYKRCKNVRELFEDLEVVDSTANNIIVYSKRIENNLFHYQITVDKEFAEKYPVAARQWTEMQYGTALQYAYGYTGRFLQPLFAHSVYPREGKTDKLEEFLNCEVLFEKERIEMVFNTSVLDLPVVTTKKELFPLFEDIMGEIEQRHGEGKFSGSVRRYMMHSLSTSSAGIKSVAGRFNMSERSLQRKLKAEDTSYQQLLDDIRRELSRKYLKERIPLAEIAFLLGFESQSAFNKFFRKHFGEAPGKRM